MKHNDDGANAERRVAEFLKRQGHKILALNWRNRWCEIDIVSALDETVYFTEVKYRSSDTWGDGLAYITPRKLKQMTFAAELWLSEQAWSGESMLQAASVTANYDIELVELA